MHNNENRNKPKKKIVPPYNLIPSIQFIFSFMFNVQQTIDDQ